MKKVSHSFITGAVALVFAILGYQTALLVHYSATAAVIAHRDSPDTVYISTTQASGNVTSQVPQSVRQPACQTVRHNAPHSDKATALREKIPPKKTESFKFDPNSASKEDLMRLGFSPKQAAAIDNYRLKGGRFRKKEDFAKSFVVSDSIYQRLEKFIDIPGIDINTADSAAFDSLPGIGGYFARKIIEYRSRLHGFSNIEQLMEIRNFDEEKFDGLKSLIYLSDPEPYPIWTLPEDSLALHPYIGRESARGVVFFRENNPREKWTAEELGKAGVISAANARRLSRCFLQN